MEGFFLAGLKIGEYAEPDHVEMGMLLHIRFRGRYMKCSH
jgi:hypothetical protein